MTPKTGRIFTAGNSAEPAFTWIICHGYAQLAEYFIEKFSVLDNGENYLVCPEGLHRFYTNGFSGRVGASWMTKEQRDADISDNINWLNNVYDNVVPSSGKIILLGFSQGGATACRWLERSGKTIDDLVLIGATFPTDVVLSGNFSRYLKGKLIYAVGSKDEFINEEEKEKQLHLLKQSGKNVVQFEFEGKHDIYPGVLLQIEKEIKSK